MAGHPALEHHVLFVTGPVRDRLYRRFTAIFDGRDDVEVRIDRRYAERRGARSRLAGGERRIGDRRRRRPDWIVPPPGESDVGLPSGS